MTISNESMTATSRTAGAKPAGKQHCVYKIAEFFPERALSAGQALTHTALRSEHAMVVFAALRPGDAGVVHNHPYDKLVVVVNGTMEFLIDGESYVLDAGSSMLIPAFAMHTGRATGTDLCTTFEVLAPVRREYLPMTAHQEESFINDGQRWVKDTEKSWS